MLNAAALNAIGKSPQFINYTLTCDLLIVG
jgi:hypothetical protein